MRLDVQAMQADAGATPVRVAQLEKQQERMAQEALACTVIVHAYDKGHGEATAEAVQQSLVIPSGLPCNQIVSCVQLKGSRQGGSAGSAGSSGAAEAASSRDAEAPEAGGSGQDAAGGERKPACNTFRVVMSSPEAARQLLYSKGKHRQLQTGLVVRQALTHAERKLQRAALPRFRELRRQGVAADFFRGKLHMRVEGKWVHVPLPR